MLRIGLTGGIGSGKTTIANIFSTLSIPVYNADSAAKRLMTESETIRKQLIERFGEKTYENGQLNRTYLASIVFNNKEKLQELNAITHPVTIQDSINWFAQQKAPYAIKEAAIIFETGSEKHLDYVIGVWAEEALRIDRVLQRDSNVTKESVKARIAQQMNEEEKMKRCDFIIDNNGLKSVLVQVYELHQRLRMTPSVN